MQKGDNHILKDIAAVLNPSFDCMSTNSFVNEYKVGQISNDLNDLCVYTKTGIDRLFVEDVNTSFVYGNTNFFANEGVIDNIFSKELLSESGLSNSFSQLRDDISYFEITIDDHLSNFDINSSSWSKYFNHEGRSKLNSFLSSKKRLNTRWDKIELLYEDFKHYYSEFLYEYLDDHLLKYIKIDQLIDPFQNYLKKVKNKFSQLLGYTNKLSKLLFESVDVKDQRFEFRKIYGFLFKNLDDESASNRLKKSVRKRPITAFNNYTYNLNYFRLSHAEQRINLRFKKNLTR